MLSGLLNGNQWFKFFQLFLADPFDPLQIRDRLKFALLIPLANDPICKDLPDSGKVDQLGLRGLVDVDEPRSIVTLLPARIGCNLL